MSSAFDPHRCDLCGSPDGKIGVGHPLMPNFGLHVWRRVPGDAGPVHWSGPPACGSVREAAESTLAAMTRLDRLLTDFKARRRRVAVFGLREVYWLARCYATLGAFEFVCGLDDEPGRPQYAALEFPIVKPEDCLRFGVEDVVLAMNAVYYGVATERLARLGLIAHPVLEPAA